MSSQSDHPQPDAAPATRSRRALLTTAAAAAAGAVASSLATAAPALGVTSNPLMLDSTTNVATLTTLVDATAVADPDPALRINAGTGPAVHGDSSSGIGVYGTSGSGNGVRGVSTSYTGVHGESTDAPGVSGKSTHGYGVKGTSTDSFGVYAASTTDVAVYGSGGYVGVWGSMDGAGAVDSVGVMGSGNLGTGVLGTTDGAGKYGVAGVNLATDPGGVGVKGDSAAGPGVKGTSSSTGVHGQSASGVGVHAESATGAALEVAGKATFTRSGRISMAKGKTSIAVTVPGGVAANSLCFANLAVYRSGVYVAAVRPNYPAGKLTIYLNKALPAATAVAWIVFG